MGEAKRKRLAAAAQEHLLEALESCSLGPPPPDGVTCVQGLFIQFGHIDKAREALGALPPRLAQYLNDADESTPADGGADVPGAVCWERWPSGREEMHLLRTPDSKIRDTYLQAGVFNAEARAYGFRVAAFPSSGWAEALETIQELHAPYLSQVAELVETTELASLFSSGPGYNRITIPKIDNDGQEAVIGAQVLRILDGMAADKESILRSYGSLRLSFDGYDDDPSEVWDIERPAQLIRILDAHAPWWPWLVADEQIYVWLGALLARSPSVVSTTFRVAFDFDDAEAEALFAKTISACTETLLAANVDMEEQSNLDRLVRMTVRMREAMEQVRQLNEALKTGAAELANKEQVLEFQRTGIADREALAKIEYATVLDRSERGQQLLTHFEEGGVLPEPMLANLLSWSRDGNEALVVISGRPDEEGSWVFRTSGTDNDELMRVIASVTADAMNAKASLAWAMGVSDALVEKLSPLVRAAAIQEAEKLGVSADAGKVELSTQFHKGLLDLATEPGGQEIDIDHVQFLTADVFGEVAELGMDGMVEQFARLRSGEISEDDLEEGIGKDVRAWQREDGSLLVREIRPPMREVVAPSGTWRLLDDAQRREVEQEVRRRQPATPKELLEYLAKSVDERIESAERQRDVRDRTIEKTTSIVGLFGRGSRSLVVLQQMIQRKEDATELADRWLESDEAYFLFWRAMDGRAAAIIADDEEQLLSEALPHALQLGDSPQSTLLLAYTDSSVDLKAFEWWRRRGGLVGGEQPTGH